MIAAGTMAGKDSMEIVVNGHEDQTIITALFDNLGKGASGAAVENITRFAHSQGYQVSKTADGPDWKLTLTK